MARWFWRQKSDYYGEVFVLLSVNVPDLRLITNMTFDPWAQNNYESFYRGEGVNSALKESIMLSSSTGPSSASSATGLLRSILIADETCELAANLLNQLLRSLQYSADLNMLRRAVDAFVKPI
jgi:hypothetical protein